jgi:putative transposase
MVLRWAAAALLATEKNFRRIMGYQDLWMLKAALGRDEKPSKEKAA